MRSLSGILRIILSLFDRLIDRLNIDWSTDWSTDWSIDYWLLINGVLADRLLVFCLLCVRSIDRSFIDYQLLGRCIGSHVCLLLTCVLCRSIVGLVVAFPNLNLITIFRCPWPDLVGWLIDWLVHYSSLDKCCSITDWLIVWLLFDWFICLSDQSTGFSYRPRIDWLVDWLTDRLKDWLIDRLIDFWSETLLVGRRYLPGEGPPRGRGQKRQARKHVL